MEARTLVQASAQIVTVLGLREGEVYKRLEPKSTYKEAKLYFGKITSVMNNGQESAIVALEYEAGFRAVTVTRKVYSGDSEIQLFPASVEEFQSHIEELRAASIAGVTAAQEALEKAQDQVQMVLDLLHSATSTVAQTSLVGVVTDEP
jgi:hypothetical protein